MIYRLLSELSLNLSLNEFPEKSIRIIINVEITSIVGINVVRLPPSFREVVYFAPFSFPFPDSDFKRKTKPFQKAEVNMLAKVF